MERDHSGNDVVKQPHAMVLQARVGAADADARQAEDDVRVLFCGRRCEHHVAGLQLNGSNKATIHHGHGLLPFLRSTSFVSKYWY